MPADPIARTRAHLDAVGANDRLAPDTWPGATVGLEHERFVDDLNRPVRYDVHPDVCAVHDWQYDLWWPDGPAGALLRALHAVDQRALAAL